jgi:hypothetical protein
MSGYSDAVSYTQDQLVSRILLDLNIAGLGQTPEASVQADLAARTQALADDLSGRRVAYLPDINQIPDGAFEALVAYMGAMIGPGYGRAGVDQATKELLEENIKSALRPTAPRRTLSTDPFLRQGSRHGGMPFNWSEG